MTTRALIPQSFHRQFLDVTRQKYDNLANRMKRLKLPVLPFTREEFRAHMLAALGGSSDGAVQCRYCHKWCTVDELAADHMMPLSRGGSIDLHNIGYPCQQCNQAKGGMTPEEFDSLLTFLEGKPFMRKDVLSRLSKTVKLAAGMLRNTARLREFEQREQSRRLAS